MTDEEYEAYRRAKTEAALKYQDFVADLLLKTLGLPVVQYVSRHYQLKVGESRNGVEIKHDEMYATTGNLWIEVAEKAHPRPGDYAPAGIERDDNTWLYVIGDYSTVFGFPKAYLRTLKESNRYRVTPNRWGTSLGFLLPAAAAARYAAFILTPDAADMRIAKVAI